VYYLRRNRKPTSTGVNSIRTTYAVYSWEDFRIFNNFIGPFVKYNRELREIKISYESD